VRKVYARKSVDFVCEECGPVKDIIEKIPQDEGAQDLKEEVPADFLVNFKPEASKKAEEPKEPEAGRPESGPEE